MAMMLMLLMMVMIIMMRMRMMMTMVTMMMMPMVLMTMMMMMMMLMMFNAGVLTMHSLMLHRTVRSVFGSMAKRGQRNPETESARLLRRLALSVEIYLRAHLGLAIQNSQVSHLLPYHECVSRLEELAADESSIQHAQHR
jgi:hypothetical protein